MRMRVPALLNRLAAVTVAATLVAAVVVWSSAPRAEAFSVDAAGADFTFRYNGGSGGNGTLISGADPATSGAVVLYDTVTTIDGVAVDAVVTTTLLNASISNYDSIGSASGNADYFQVDNSVSSAGGFTSFQFSFYEHGSYTGVGTGIPVILLNVAVTSIDIDAPGQQFQDFVGYQT